MKQNVIEVHNCNRPTACCCIIIFIISFLFIFADHASAQHRTSKTYPARKSVRLQLTNRSGSIFVEGWDRNEIKVTADMETPIGRFTLPEVGDDGLVIDMMQDMRGKPDAGDVTFYIQVPSSSTVDLETKRGNITVSRVHGALVRARVSSEGDINLTSIRAATVMARNTMGNILFDGELVPGGTYDFTSMQGDTNIRFPASTGVFLTAAAPFTRRIDLGGFAGMSKCDSLSGNRKVVCKMGDGAASLNVTNHRGPIIFIRR